ncbi:hypothetical protein KM043_004797 [Ampulex compressa]|nr:hypothetical protein KM043_004797 [Ampulex compressa]
MRRVRIANIRTTLVYNVVRGLHNKSSQVREILKTQRDKKLDEILEIMKEKEREITKKNGGDNSSDVQEGAYAARDNHQKERGSVTCAASWGVSLKCAITERTSQAKDNT